MKLTKELTTAALAIVVLTLVLGLAYPLVMTGISQVAFPSKADGSQVKVDGKVVGSRLIAKAFTLKGGKPDPRYFQPRPSQSDYSATGTFFSNRGPNSASAQVFYRKQLDAYLALERPYDPGLTAGKVPVDAVTTSGSGVDPHISKANAAIQAHRIAAVRHLSLARVNALIESNTEGRFLGVIGEPGVNVLELNLALDKEAHR
ncbi:MAG TPA: potassium-transporting ATPase subunit KdpC [Solirubrobacteraceae bacterium]|nr:potassium-transporting ATPase subunit KdpC [Solirubrobacteraceae bacterium]